MSVPSSGKKVVVSVGPIPARLDSVKFVTNRFKGGLAVRTAYQLAKLGHDVTIVAWKYTDVPSDIMSPEPDHDRKAGDLIEYPGVREVVRVADVLEYYDWFVANAKNYDAFVMAAAVANLTPVKPYEGKFPSHLYKPGDEFDIKFMIAPRAIDAVKQINPRACLVGYKLFDTPDDDALIRIARHTLADAKANIIFANRPSDAKTRKIAVTADGATFETDFNGHVNLIDRAIRQEYFRTKVSPLTDKEKSDPEVAAAFALVERFEKTFDGYGTVAFPAGKGRFATTARGHRPGGPVLVRCIDPYGRVIHASGKATLNAPLLSRLVRNDAFVVHRHYDDPLAQTANDSLRPHDVLYVNGQYVFPGTIEEYDTPFGDAVRIEQPHHGYVQQVRFETIDWKKYHETFPDRYFGVPDKFRETIDKYTKDPSCENTLEVGGNRTPSARWSYDPYVRPENASVPVTLEQVDRMKFGFGFCRNSICYLTEHELRVILDSCDRFMANAPAVVPDMKVRGDEVAVRSRQANFDTDLVTHFLVLPGDRVIRHEFFAYGTDFYESMGLSVKPYGKNSVLLTKNV